GGAKIEAVAGIPAKMADAVAEMEEEREAPTEEQQQAEPGAEEPARRRERIAAGRCGGEPPDEKDRADAQREARRAMADRKHRGELRLVDLQMGRERPFGLRHLREPCAKARRKRRPHHVALAPPASQRRPLHAGTSPREERGGGAGSLTVEKPGDQTRTSCAIREILCTEIFVLRKKTPCRTTGFCDHRRMARESADPSIGSGRPIWRWVGSKRSGRSRASPPRGGLSGRCGRRLAAPTVSRRALPCPVSDARRRRRPMRPKLRRQAGSPVFADRACGRRARRCAGMRAKPSPSPGSHRRKATSRPDVAGGGASPSARGSGAGSGSLRGVSGAREGALAPLACSGPPRTTRPVE